MLQEQGISEIAGCLLDLGVSSPQIDQAARGFSFRFDGPLDMRMDTTQGESVSQWLSHVSEKELTVVIKTYGEERFAARIARAIITRQTNTAKLGPLDSTSELARLIADCVKTREGGQHPATRTFQALRIHINQELSELTEGLAAAWSALQVGGRLVVISFHSLEDRIVKRFMQEKAVPPTPDRRLPLRQNDLPKPELILRGKQRPSQEEIQLNPRARSAMMRVAEKCKASCL